MVEAGLVKTRFRDKLGPLRERAKDGWEITRFPAGEMARLLLDDHDRGDPQGEA